MKRLAIALVLAIATVLLPISASACDTETEATPGSECVVMSRAGVRGVWLKLEVADELRKLKLELPELRLQITNMEQQLQLRASQVSDLSAALRQRTIIAEELMKANEALVRDAATARSQRDEAIASRDSFWRSPFLWTAVGSIGTIGAGLGVKYVF